MLHRYLSRLCTYKYMYIYMQNMMASFIDKGARGSKVIKWKLGIREWEWTSEVTNITFRVILKKIGVWENKTSSRR